MIGFIELIRASGFAADVRQVKLVRHKGDDLDMDTVLDSVSGIMFGGSLSNIHPSFYDDEHPGLGLADKPRDATVLRLAARFPELVAAAQAAADDYLHSVQASLADTNATAANTLSQARSEAKRILEQAQADADSLKAQAQQECDAMTAAAAQKRTQTEADCKAMVERAEQEVQQRWQAFDRKANDLLDQYHSTDGLPSEET